MATVRRQPNFWAKCYRRPQDDTVSTIFQWLYARMDAVHSGPKG